ncbi:olfactory receptor 13G1-like [Erpetoichthys calabaricus]|uniref:olfactory receptor 13G1-like n=1 Tax=Erpetoichthys calabaricus TaxID=27687 RepID=UPI002233F614|nr:olfactory receptor 13G1-like [Erpetoichthys calabaricus]
MLPSRSCAIPDKIEEQRKNLGPKGKRRLKMESTVMRNASVFVSEFVLHCEVTSQIRSFTVVALAIIYLVTLVGNILVLLAIILNHQLHTPMFVLIAILAIIDLLNNTNLIPKMMALLLFDTSPVPYHACVLQMLKMESTAMRNETVFVSEFVLHCEVTSQIQSFTVVALAIIYLMTLVANILVLLVIILNHQLHTPMFVLIATLAVIDLLNNTNLIPKMMALLLFDTSPVPYGTCVLQVYVVFHLEIFESFLLALMACDRYIAVIHPLRYPQLVNGRTIAHAALKISSSEGKGKVFNVLVTHLLVVLLFYLPLLTAFILPRIGVNLSTEAYNTLITIAAIVPPMINPIIYSFRNMEMKNAIKKLFTGKRTTQQP